LFLLLTFGCSGRQPSPSSSGALPKPYRVGKNVYQPLLDARDFKQRGIASWYGRKFHGRKTSNGEVYNMYAMTAAHKTLPFGTLVKVRNLDNNREVVVRINDRGPFVRDRVIDLSYSAAQRIAMVGPGTAPVEVYALGVSGSSPRGVPASISPPVDSYYEGKFTIQIGAFRERNNAERLKRRLEQSYENVYISDFNNGGEKLYRVRVGRYATLQAAIARESNLIENGFPNAFAVAE
jgi:rare lipoprotein A